MDSPSWKDALIGSCLQCFKTPAGDSDSESIHNHPQRPSRHLEPLLEPLLTDTDTEAETLSLHSNIGDTRRQRKQKQKQKRNNIGISFFGFDLFGKQAAPIHLPEDEDEVDELLRRRDRRRPNRDSSSSITFDGSVSDAAPLDSAAIGERVVQEEELRAIKEREKEERRRKRKERKEMKRLAQALVQNRDDGEFEGFQGSGDNVGVAGSYPNIPSPFQQARYSHSPHTEEFGPFRSADEDDADLDGAVYVARNDGSSVSGGGSDSRRSPGGTSASRSDHSYSRLPGATIADLSASTQIQPKKKKSKKSPSLTSSNVKSSTSRSSASATSSDQTSLASPASLMSPIYSDELLADNFPRDSALESRKKPTLVFEGSGFPNSGVNADDRSFPSPGLGFNAPRNFQARGGAFLASRD